MASSSETKKGSSQKVIIIVGVIVIVALLGAVIFLLSQRQQTNIDDGNASAIGYASGAKTMLDQDSLQAAIDEAMQNALDGNVGLQYQNDAYSKDGKTFSCRIVNSDANIYDMFLTIFADSQLTDQIFLSGLVRPGDGFEEITLDRALEAGSHTVYVALTQVDTDKETGEQVIKNQVMHTMEFHVEA